MLKNKKILAIIPARGGSKGVLKKNIKQIANKPLIAWTIEAAKHSAYIDRIVVSTDNFEIASVAKEYGAQIPFLRPNNLATDKARSIDVIKHTIEWFENSNDFFDTIILLQPTSPLRTAQDIDNAFLQFERLKAKAIISVCEVSHHPFWSNSLPADHCMRDFIRQDVKDLNRQELPSFYQLNGAIYISEIDYFKNNNGFLGSETFAFIMPKDRSIDIDTEIDFKLAEILLKENANN